MFLTATWVWQWSRGPMACLLPTQRPCITAGCRLCLQQLLTSGIASPAPTFARMPTAALSHLHQAAQSSPWPQHVLKQADYSPRVSWGQPRTLRGLCCCPQIQPGSAALCKDVKLCKWSSSSVCPAFSHPSLTGARPLAGKLSWNGCFSCSPPVWHWRPARVSVTGAPLSPPSPRVISEGTRMAGGHLFSCHILSGLGWLCLLSAAPTWAKQPLLQDGGSGDPGRGRIMVGRMGQHSWWQHSGGRGLIQHSGWTAGTRVRKELFYSSASTCPGLLCFAVIYISFAHAAKWITVVQSAQFHWVSASLCPGMQMSVPYLGTAGQLSSPGHSCQMARYGLQIWGSAEPCPWPAECVQGFSARPQSCDHAMKTKDGESITYLKKPLTLPTTAVILKTDNSKHICKDNLILLEIEVFS